MTKFYLILTLLMCITLYGQDTDYLYEINFAIRHQHCDRNINDTEYKKLWSHLKNVYELDSRDKNVTGLFSVKEMVNCKGASLYRTGTDCDDCRLQYTLFYEYKDKVVLIDGEDPVKLLNKILSEFKKDTILPDEETVHKITKEVFFYVKYTAAHANFSGVPLYKESE